MSSIIEFIGKALAYSNAHKWFNWAVGHSILPLLFTGLGWMTGSPIWGASVGLVMYWGREIEQSWPAWRVSHRVTFTKDNIGDLAAPTLIFALTVLKVVF